MEDHPFPMVVLEAPKRDSRGRIVNEEDAEARAAAKEQRRQRDAANKAAAEERKRQAAQALLEAQAAPDRAEEKPARKRRRRRGKSASQEVQAVQPPQVPTQEPGHRGKLTRPGARMETGSAMPRTEFDRPDPLSGDHIMDATARLLAPRKPVSAQESHREGSRRSAPRSRKHSSRDAGSRQTPVKAEDPRKTRSGHSAHPDRKAAPAPGGSHRPDRRRTHAGPRGPIEPMKSSRTKDSTEQHSLMKPYYLDN